MKLTGKEDLRVQKTIRAIRESFAELIAKKDYEKITVKELCEKAMINKKTFYQYYEDLDALLSEIQLELTKDYLERVKGFKYPEDLAKANREFFLFSSEQGKLYEKITCSGNLSSVRKSMIDNVMEDTWKKSRDFSSMDAFHQNLLLNFINTVTIENYKLWIESGKKQSLEEITKLTEALVTSGTKGYLKNIKEK